MVEHKNSDPEIRDSISERVRKGASILDEKKPKWRESINTSILDMTSPAHCILGQIYGDFGKGLDKLKIGSAATYGFCVFSMVDWNSEFPLLKQEWIQEVKKVKEQKT